VSGNRAATSSHAGSNWLPDNGSRRVAARSASGGQAIGFDAGKRTRGRKRHLLVDTTGLMATCVVHSASVHRAGAKLVLCSISDEYPTVGLVWADGGYVNSVDATLIDWCERELGIRLKIVKRNDDVKGLQAPSPPVGGRADVGVVDALPAVCAATTSAPPPTRRNFIKMAMIRLMAARLAGQQTRYRGIR
jgi:Transposase DDE domain